jgi:hypothetical protein
MTPLSAVHNQWYYKNALGGRKDQSSNFQKLVHHGQPEAFPLPPASYAHIVGIAVVVVVAAAADDVAAIAASFARGPSACRVYSRANPTTLHHSDEALAGVV